MSVCCSDAAVQVEPVSDSKSGGKMKTFTSHISVRPTFLLQVLDTTSGSPGRSLPVTLYEQTTKKGWEVAEEGCTLDDGQMKLLKGRSLTPGGRYKLHLDTGSYFSQKGGQPICPFIELGLQTPPDCQNLHVSVHIGLHGYTTYIGT
ncbi:5-hydroxyisourate hydrolase-like [Haliotis rufescens]|uniref:5-hydroxyisourate hydrolase-like n=1 Tax=Haliotis rufescens TaxID=6454 RepID=UPI001EAFFDBB|nr:5-hydroxyisourate hydrolase-like [Haliotis rufescens]